MKTLIRFLSVLLCVAPFGVANAVVSSTAGNNLTAYNGESGASNNNYWNSMMNTRSGGNSGTTATADFGNCNAIIMRCAQPKCNNGGCTDLDVTFAIVNGCVQSNNACKKYGDELTQYISAQLVAQSTARANADAVAAQNAATSAAAEQNAQQMAMMQAQMQQMQAEMAAQNAQTVAQLQSALDEQKQLTANAIAEATAARETQVAPVINSASVVTTNTTTTNAASDTSGLTGAQLEAAQKGVSADILAREQISGQILSAIENAEVQLKTLKTTMQDVFKYAGCDSRGNNCTGPKRVKMFKDKAEGFFDPYENVLDELYDALLLAQSVGVDINDIYMMLSGSCNMWGKYACEENQPLRYTKNTCKDGTSVTPYSEGQGSKYIIGGAKCTVGKIIPTSDGGCQPLGKLDSSEEVRYNWLYQEEGDAGFKVMVGCMSDALDDSTLFRGRKKQATIDAETLQRMIAQDAPTYNRSKNALDREQVKYCAVTDATYANLQKLVTTKSLPTKDLCVNESRLDRLLRDGVTLVDSDSIVDIARKNCTNRKNAQWSENLWRCFCETKDGSSECDVNTSKDKMLTEEDRTCRSYGGKYNSSTQNCDCNAADYSEDKERCEYKFHKYKSGSIGNSSRTSLNFDVNKISYNPNQKTNYNFKNTASVAEATTMANPFSSNNKQGIQKIGDKIC